MTLVIREITSADLKAAAEICYEAFRAISNAHGFPADLPSTDVAEQLLGFLYSRKDVFGVVAIDDSRVVGSNFLWEGTVSGVGPVTVDRAVQNSGVGKCLMQAVLRRAEEGKSISTRLVQAGYHTRSLCLYTKLGFISRETLAVMTGKPLMQKMPGYLVRKATIEDYGAAAELSLSLQGFERGPEFLDSVLKGSAYVVERAGRISGYTTGIAYFGHTIGETNNDVKALVGAAEAFGGLGFMVPIRNEEIFNWCLSNGLVMVQPMTLMTKGLYESCGGAFLPSIFY